MYGHGGFTLKFEKVETSALIVLFIGVALLAFTFFSAYTFLVGSLTIVASSDLTELFGRALGPLIEAIIRILFLGVMGWVGSILTIRAVQLLKKDKEPIVIQPQSKLEPKQANSQPIAATNPSPKQQIDEPKAPKNTGSASTEAQKTPQPLTADAPAA